MLGVVIGRSMGSKHMSRIEVVVILEIGTPVGMRQRELWRGTPSLKIVLGR